MRSIFVIGLMFAATLTLSIETKAQGYTTIEFSKVQVTRALSGIVEDSGGSPIPGVEIALRTKDWKTVRQTAVSDSEGRFSIAPASSESLYYLEFHMNGLNPTRMRVKVSPKSKKQLKVVMQVSS